MEFGNRRVFNQIVDGQFDHLLDLWWVDMELNKQFPRLAADSQLGRLALNLEKNRLDTQASHGQYEDVEEEAQFQGQISPGEILDPGMDAQLRHEATVAIWKFEMLKSTYSSLDMMTNVRLTPLTPQEYHGIVVDLNRLGHESIERIHSDEELREELGDVLDSVCELLIIEEDMHFQTLR